MNGHCILVPLDGSALAQAALPSAATLARVEGCGIALLAAVQALDGMPHRAPLESLVADRLLRHGPDVCLVHPGRTVAGVEARRGAEAVPA